MNAGDYDAGHLLALGLDDMAALRMAVQTDRIVRILLAQLRQRVARLGDAQLEDASLPIDAVLAGVPARLAVARSAKLLGRNTCKPVAR